MDYLPDSHSELVWISPQDQLPDVCCTCGMFTDRRVKVKFVDKREVVHTGQSGGMTLLHIVCVFLGPIGWLLAAIVGSANEHSEKTKLKTDAKTLKVKISQCQLCNGMSLPEVVHANRDSRQLAFITHPEFCKKFDEANFEA